MIKTADITKLRSVDVYCDKCGKRMTMGDASETEGAQYAYVCECGETLFSDKLYPYWTAEVDDKTAVEYKED